MWARRKERRGVVGSVVSTDARTKATCNCHTLQKKTINHLNGITNIKDDYL